MDTGKRYPVCSCHPNHLNNAPNENVEVDYGKCARRCAFCGRLYKEAPDLRKHGPKCKLSTGIQIKSHKHGQVIEGHSWSYLPGCGEEPASELGGQSHRRNVQNEMKPVTCQSLPFRMANQLDNNSFHTNDVQSLLEDLDGFDESIKALLNDIPLSTVENMSEATREEWKKSTTSWARTFLSEDFFEGDPPSNETLIRDILTGPSSGKVFCKGDMDPGIDSISVISQLHEPNPKSPLAILGIRPSTISSKLTLWPPTSFSAIVEPFDIGNQQVLLTTKFWETDLHLDHLDGLSAILGPGKKLWLTFPPTDHNILLLKGAEGRKAKLLRIGKNLQHGLIHRTTSLEVIYLPIGCIHYVVSTHGGLLITIDFIAPESSRALSSLILSRVDESNISWQEQLFKNFLRAIELGLNNNQISNALSSWIRIEGPIKEWAKENNGWKMNASKMWNSFFRSTLSKNASCPCQNAEFNQSLEEHFRAVHMFSKPRSRR